MTFDLHLLMSVICTHVRTLSGGYHGINCNIYKYKQNHTSNWIKWNAAWNDKVTVPFELKNLLILSLLSFG